MSNLADLHQDGDSHAEDRKGQADPLDPFARRQLDTGGLDTVPPGHGIDMARGTRTNSLSHFPTAPMEVTQMGQTMRVALPDGTYATPDPDQPDDVTTLWVVHDGKLSAWPRGHRWAPLPPRAPEDLTPAERAEWRQRWYDRTYFPWKDRVIDAIAADLVAAAWLFDDLVPERERPAPDEFRRPRQTPLPYMPRPPRVPGAGKKRKRDKAGEEAFKAATLADAGMTVRRVAQLLEMSRMTTWRRIQDGRVEHGELLTRMRTLSRGGPFVMPGRKASDAETS